MTPLQVYLRHHGRDPAGDLRRLFTTGIEPTLTSFFDDIKSVAHHMNVFPVNSEGGDVGIDRETKKTFTHFRARRSLPVPPPTRARAASNTRTDTIAEM